MSYKTCSLCAVHVIFEMFLLASNIEIVIELWMFIYILLFWIGEFQTKFQTKLLNGLVTNGLDGL